MELEKDCIVCAALFLNSTALIWYDDNVDGLDHLKETWSFKTVVTGLHDLFMHHAVVNAATDKFWNTTYVHGGVVQGAPLQDVT